MSLCVSNANGSVGLWCDHPGCARRYWPLLRATEAGPLRLLARVQGWRMVPVPPAAQWRDVCPEHRSLWAGAR